MPDIPDPNMSDPDEEIEQLYADRPPPESFADAVREAPLVAVATAFIAGLLIGRLIL
jgi:hypothetical protein